MFQNAVKALISFIEDKATVLMIFACIAYFLFLGVLSILDHWGLRTQLSDLGHMEQAIWQITQGNWTMPLSDPIINTSRFAQHANVIFYFLAPFYAIAPHPETLLLIGTTAIASAGFFMFLLAKSLTKNNIVALIFGIGLLVNPLVQETNLYDFHPITLAIPLFILVIYFAHKKIWVAYWVSLFLLMTVKEDMVLLAFFIGLFFTLKKLKNIGPLTMIIAILYGIAIISLSPILYDTEVSKLQYSRFAHIAQSPQELVSNVFVFPELYISEFSQEDSLQYLAYLFIQRGFLYLATPLTLFWSAPNIAQNILAHSDWQTRITEVYYSGIVITTLYTSAIYGYLKISRYSNRLSKILLLFFCIQIIATTIFLSPTPYSLNKKWNDYSINHNLQTMKGILDLIPSEASVTAQNNIAAHLSNRNTIIKASFNRYEMNTEYILLHVKDPRSSSDNSEIFTLNSPSHHYPEGNKNYFNFALKPAFKNNNYGILKYQDSWYLFKKNHDTALNQSAYEQALLDLATHNKKTTQ